MSIILFAGVLVLISSIIAFSMQRISYKEYSSLERESERRRIELIKNLESLNEQIKVLTNFAGEELHDRAVKLSDWGKNKDVDWLIYITQILRRSSSYEEFEDHLNRDDRFVEEKQLLIKEIADRCEHSKMNAQLGFIAFYLQQRVSEEEEKIQPAGKTCIY